MPTNNILRVAEFEKLYYDDEKPFKQKHWEALCRYAEGVHKKEIQYFRILNKGIQFTNYVGVIQAGNITIEVLPKTDRGTATAINESSAVLKDESKEQWHGVLLQMLNECRLLKANPISNAYLNLHHHSILDIYLELFLAEAEQVLHDGLLKNYHQQEGNQTALKGQLLFQKQLARNGMHQERFYVRHTAYESNNVYNCILYTTLQLIYKNSNNPDLSEKAGRLLLRFPELPPITITASTFQTLSFDRNSGRYAAAMRFAKLLLLQYRPDITGGGEHIMAILFDMNLLWEEWVYRRMKKEETAFGITVERQPSAPFWKGDDAARPKTIRPDIVIRKGAETIIVDTKWKILEDLTPDDADLKQLFVYNLYWKCKESILLYPASTSGNQKGSYKNFIKSEDPHSHCMVVTATVFDEAHQLNVDFAGAILEKFLQRIPLERIQA